MKVTQEHFLKHVELWRMLNNVNVLHVGKKNAILSIRGIERKVKMTAKTYYDFWDFSQLIFITDKLNVTFNYIEKLSQNVLMITPANRTFTGANAS